MRQPHQLYDGTALPLTALGFSAGADLIYRYLLASGGRSAENIQSALGMPRYQVAAGLEELRAAGAASQQTGHRDVVWAPVSLSDVASSLRGRRRRRAGPSVRHRDSYAVMERMLPGSVPLGDGLRHLPSRALARARMGDLVGLVRYEHMAMSPERVYDAESAQAAVPLDRKLLRRGVRMRVIGAQPAGTDPLVGYGRAPDELRPDYRESPDVRMKLVVLDRRVAMFPVAPADLDRGYLEVTDEAVVAHLAALFEKEWAAAERVEEGRMPQIVLTERERALVALLAQGTATARPPASCGSAGAPSVARSAT